MKIVNTNSAVNTASINTPLATLVSALSVVRTFNGVGNMTLTRKLAKMLPAICAVSSNPALDADIDFVKSIAKVTAGLNNPPDMRKKIQTLTMREKPKTREMYWRTCGEKPVSAPVVVLDEPADWMLATWVPEKAKKRNWGWLVGEERWGGGGRAYHGGADEFADEGYEV